MPPRSAVAIPKAVEVEVARASSMVVAAIGDVGWEHREQRPAVTIPDEFLEEIASHYSKGGWMWNDAGEKHRSLEEASELALFALADELFLRKCATMKGEADREAIEPRFLSEDVDTSSKFAYFFIS